MRDTLLMRDPAETATIGDVCEGVRDAIREANDQCEAIEEAAQGQQTELDDLREAVDELRRTVDELRGEVEYDREHPRG